TAIHRDLAEPLKEKIGNKPTLVIGFAETATGIGYGVFEQLDIPDSFYLHTTRYKTSNEKMLSFQEEHCHAPSHILYDVKDPALKKILKTAENIILVDDEVTTGKTLTNIIKNLRQSLPWVKNYYAVSVINWMSDFPEE